MVSNSLRALRTEYEHLVRVPLVDVVHGEDAAPAVGVRIGERAIRVPRSWIPKPAIDVTAPVCQAGGRLRVSLDRYGRQTLIPH